MRLSPPSSLATAPRTVFRAGTKIQPTRLQLPIYSFAVPGPPVPKQRPRRNASGVWYTPTRTKRYEAKVAWCARSAGLSAPLTGPVRLEILLWLSDRRRRDVDNIAKSIVDGLNRIAWADDSQVTSLTISRAGVDRDRPRTEVTIHALPPEAEVETHAVTRA